MTPAAARRLAARADARQAEAIARADAAADLVGQGVGGVWREVLRLLRQPPHWGAGYHQALQLFGLLQHLPQQRLAEALARMARWGHRSAAAGMMQALPLRLLLRAAQGGVVKHGTVVPGNGRGGRLLGRGGLDTLESLAPLREDEGAAPAPASTAIPNLTFADLLAALRDARALVTGMAPAAEQKALLAKLLFPAPSPEMVHRVIYASDWQARLAASTRLAAPEVLAGILAGGLAWGKDPRQIARDLLPHVEDVRSTARRVARTEALRVAGYMQRASHAVLGDLQIGWELRATHDKASRPWHAAREGRRYYFNPGPGEDGMEKCPFPPDEPLDPNQRPAKAPAIAFNCRCYLVPVLRED